MKKVIFFILIIAIFASLIFYRNSPRTVTRSRFVMGTTAQITIRARRTVDFNKAFNAAFNAMDIIDKDMSLFRKKSELNLINEKAYQSYVNVSNDMFYVISESIKLSKVTGGVFDITIEPLLDLWGFYNKQYRIPEEQEIDEVLQLVGYEKILIDKKKKVIKFKSRGMGIDLGAVAKGFAADKAVAALKKNKIKNALVNLGGDLYCLGKGPQGNGWLIGIRNPLNKRQIIERIRLIDKACATSGGYEQFFEVEGQSYPHVLNPKTGFPIDEFTSATVIAKDCLTADALATASCLLDKEKLKQLQELLGIRIYRQ